jgi:hypothetical protein
MTRPRCRRRRRFAQIPRDQLGWKQEVYDGVMEQQTAKYIQRSGTNPGS